MGSIVQTKTKLYNPMFHFSDWKSISIQFVAPQVMEDGRPWLDMAHVISCLNKFDAGVQDKISLMSRDEQNVLVVSYAELKECLVLSYSECMQSAKQASTRR